MSPTFARLALSCGLLLALPYGAAAQEPPPSSLPSTIPAVTAADRQAAFPEVSVRPVMDNSFHSFLLLDRLEWQRVGRDGGPSWEARGWWGRDRDRLWFRTEGDTEAGRIGSLEAHALYGRAIARWWDFVTGVRQDVRPSAPQTWAAIGIQGLAPYWFNIEATAYVGGSGRTQFRFETEYELLVTNRVILQSLIEINILGKADPTRGLGAGLSSTEIGVRLRFLIKREFAPYLGVTWNQRHFGTADFAKAAGDRTGGARVIVGVRLWR